MSKKIHNDKMCRTPAHSPTHTFCIADIHNDRLMIVHCLVSKQYCTHVDEHDDDHFDVLGNIDATYCWKNFDYSTSWNCFRRSRHFFVHSYKQNNNFSIEFEIELKYIQFIGLYRNFSFYFGQISLLEFYTLFIGFMEILFLWNLLIRSKNMSIRFRTGWWFMWWCSIAEWAYI